MCVQGLHLVYHGQVGAAEAGLRTGLFLSVTAGDVVVLQWQSSLELLTRCTSGTSACPGCS